MRYAVSPFVVASLLACASPEAPPCPSCASRDAAPSLDAAPDAGGVLPSDDAGAGTDAADASALDCGEHGELHGDHCHCAPGYEVRDRTCMPIAACTGDDAFEPDDRPSDARPWPEGEPSLARWLCPGDRDWIEITAETEEILTIECRFSHAEIDIDLALWEPGRDPRFDGPVVRASSGSDLERIVHRVRRSGPHRLRIASNAAGAQGAYRVSLTRDAPERDAGAP